MEGRVIKVAGPLVVASLMRDCKMYEVVHIGEKNLVGEIIELRDDKASIQVYEETSGLGVGEKVVGTGEMMSVELAPGLIKGIFDGIQRPLDKIYEKYGNMITRGVEVEILDRKKLWHFYPEKKIGDYVESGDVLGYVDETPAFRHKIMVPFGVKGEVKDIKEGNFTMLGVSETE